METFQTTPATSSSSLWSTMKSRQFLGGAAAGMAVATAGYLGYRLATRARRAAEREVVLGLMDEVSSKRRGRSTKGRKTGSKSAQVPMTTAQLKAMQRKLDSRIKRQVSAVEKAARSAK